MADDRDDSTDGPATRTLSEADSRRLVADAGVVVSDWATASDPDAAAEVAVAMGLPVVAKLCGDSIAD